MDKAIRKRISLFFSDRFNDDPFTTIYDLKEIKKDLENDSFNNWNADIKELNIILAMLHSTGINENEKIFYR